MAIRGEGRRPQRPGAGKRPYEPGDISNELDTLDETREGGRLPEAGPVTAQAVEGEPRGVAEPPEAERAAAEPAAAAELALLAEPAALAEPVAGAESAAAERASLAELALLAELEPPALDTSAGAARKRIGVVVIHGIGDQKPGETLLLWAHSLLRVVGSWAATTPGVNPANDHAWTADIDLSGENRPWVAIDVPGDADHAPQSWLMTEAWWAARVQPPTLAQMFTWLVSREEMRRLISGMLRALNGVEADGNRQLQWVDRIFVPLFALVAVPLATLLYAVLSLVRLIPIKRLQDFVLFKGLDFFLVDWFGDLRTLLVDRTQAASIRVRAADAIRDCMARGCEDVVVIGHSGGTVVGYTTLVDPAYPDLQVRRFVTLGQALGMSWNLGRFDVPPTADRDDANVYPGDRLHANLAAVRPETQWFDFWATHDPAPAGGFDAVPAACKPPATGGVSTRIFNRMSMLEDHGGYWDNDEEFLLPVARLIDTTPGKADPTTSRFFPGPNDRVARRQARVKTLQRSWVAVMAAGALVGLLGIVNLVVALAGHATPAIETAGGGAWGAATTVSHGVVGWLLNSLDVTPPTGELSPVLASLLGAVLIGAALWAVGAVASGIWSSWDRRERQIALQPSPAWRPMWTVGLPIGICGAGALLLLPLVVTGNWLFALPTLVLVAVAWVMGIVVRLGYRGSVTNPTT